MLKPPRATSSCAHQRSVISRFSGHGCREFIIGSHAGGNFETSSSRESLRNPSCRAEYRTKQRPPFYNFLIYGEFSPGIIATIGIIIREGLHTDLIRIGAFRRTSCSNGTGRPRCLSWCFAN